MFKYIWDVLYGTFTQLRSLVMVFGHAFRPRDTLQYPEEAVYLPPRYRGHEDDLATVYGCERGVEPIGLNKAWSWLSGATGVKTSKAAA